MKLIIQVDVPVTKEAKCGRWLAQYNQQRKRNGQGPLANLKAALEETVERQLQEIYVSADKHRGRSIMHKFLTADDEVQAQVETLLDGV